jgi:pyruvate/2-oxoglutarate dehydrogenase complex dihydrolipoamide dehydrogenase (E3) component
MIEQSKHYALAIACGAKRGPKDSDLTFSPASLRDFVAAVNPPAAQQEPEFECPRCGHCCPQRQWVGLTDDEVLEIERYAITKRQATRSIEAKLKEKNHG